jgi:hypothetical protein
MAIAKIVVEVDESGIDVIETDGSEITVIEVGVQGPAGPPGDGSGGGGVTDHGDLTGLDGDDHNQYHNDARGDSRYYTKSQVDTSLGGKANSSHSHAIGDVSGLQNALDAKQAAGSYAASSHTHSAESITGLATVATTGSYNDLSDKPAGSSSPLSAKGDVYTRTSSVDARLAVGTNGYRMQANSNATTGLEYTPPYPDPAYNCVVHTDFMEGLSRSPFTSTTSGGGSVGDGGAGSSNFVGTQTLATNTSSASAMAALVPIASGIGNSNMALNVTGRRFSVKSRIFLATLPTGAEDFYLFTGLCNNTSASDLTAATATCGMYYSSASANWQIFTRFSATNTFTDTGVPVVASTAYNVEFVAIGNNTVGSIAFELYINGAKAGATVTGFVSNALNVWPAAIRKIAGTGNRQLIVDACTYALGRE